MAAALDDLYGKYAELAVRVGATCGRAGVLVNAFVEHAPMARRSPRRRTPQGRATWTSGTGTSTPSWPGSRRPPRSNNLSFVPPWSRSGRAVLEAGMGRSFWCAAPGSDLFGGIDGRWPGSSGWPVIKANLPIVHREQVNWTMTSPTRAAARIGEANFERLGKALSYAARLDEPDPVAAWDAHSNTLRHGPGDREPALRRGPVPRAGDRPARRAARPQPVAERRCELDQRPAHDREPPDRGGANTDARRTEEWPPATWPCAARRCAGSSCASRGAGWST